MLGISDAAEAIGFRTRGYRLTWEQLRDDVPLPCIVHWNQRHFIVVYDIKKNRKKGATVRVADPAAGLLEYTEEEFKKSWLSTKTDGVDEGVALLLEPAPEFYDTDDGEKHKFNFARLLGYIRPYSKFIGQLMLGMLTASIISLIFPFLTQALVDTGIGNGNMTFVVMVLVAQLILSLSQTANSLLRSWINLHVTSRVSISLISDFLIKLMKLPISFSMSKWWATSCSV
jgi:ATP-binding cassette subfamily B protein